MIFYESWIDAAMCLPEEEANRVIVAIAKYGCKGIEPQLTGAAQAVYLMAKPLIDANEAKRVAGAKGGRPRKNAEPVPAKSNKFVNFKHSGRDWDDLADQIMAKQTAQ